MATLYSRRAMRHIEPRTGTLTWADIERPPQTRAQLPPGMAFALAFAAVLGFAAGVALVLIVTGR